MALSAPMVEMTHASVAGSAFVTQDAFEAVWQAKGWILVAPDVIINLPALMLWTGAWSSVEVYKAGDVVSYSDDGYIAKTVSQNVTPTSSNTHWELVTTGTGPAPATPDATTVLKGKLQLAGDLAGTAAAPAVPGLATKVPLSQRGVANGVATLAADGKIPSSQIPALALGDTFSAASQAAMLALAATPGDVAVRTDTDPDTTFLLTASPASTLANWVPITPPGSVFSVDGQTGAVDLSGTYGSASNSPVTVTANYTVLPLDSLVRGNATSGAITVTLPAAPSPGGLYAVSKVDASGNSVTVAPGAGVLKGTSTLKTQDQMGLYAFDGTNWNNVASLASSGSGSAYGGGGLTLPVSGGSIAPLALSLGADVWSANGLMRAAPLYVPRAITAVGLGIEVTTAGGAGATMRLGIYSALSTGYPGALVIDGGTVAATGTGMVSVTISQALDTGLYWLVAVPQGTPSPLPALRYIATSFPLVAQGGYVASSGASTQARCFKVAGVTGALPASPSWSGDLNAPYTQLLVA